MAEPGWAMLRYWQPRDDLSKHTFAEDNVNMASLNVAVFKLSSLEDFIRLEVVVPGIKL